MQTQPNNVLICILKERHVKRCVSWVFRSWHFDQSKAPVFEDPGMSPKQSTIYTTPFIITVNVSVNNSMTSHQCNKHSKKHVLPALLDKNDEVSWWIGDFLEFIIGSWDQALSCCRFCVKYRICDFIILVCPLAPTVLFQAEDRTTPLLLAAQHAAVFHCVKSLLSNFNNTLLITLEQKEQGGGHRAAKPWIGLISGGEGSDAYISYTGVTLPDLRQISHLKQLFAITKCGIHYKRFFSPSFNIISYCSRENGKRCCGEKGIVLF